MSCEDTVPSVARQSAPPVRCLTRISQIPGLPAECRDSLESVAQQFPFRATDYYLGLIDWSDPLDPIRQLVIPRPEEMNAWGHLDASNETAHTVMPGVQHKYPDTAVLLCTGVCAGLCRYCFRKRLFMGGGGEEAGFDLSTTLNYIYAHPGISNVLLTGGDPLLMSTPKLAALLGALRAIPHVAVIRIGTKVPAFNPRRVLDDDALLQAIRRYSTSSGRIYFMTHFDHPRELTDQALQCIDRLLGSGAVCANQCPLTRGVNDDPAVLSELYRRLAWAGCPPYYLFQMRPTVGNQPYAVPLVRGWEIFRQALRHGSGLARRARFVMSHATGKIEILAVDADRIYLRYQRARDAELRGRFLVCRRDDQAYWLDDLEPVDGLDVRAYSPVSPTALRESSV